MKGPLLLAVLLLVVPATAAQSVEPGPDVVMLVHHPFPDDADILGVPFQEGCTSNSTNLCDAFAARHGGRDVFRDGFAYPGFVADGRIAMDGLPGDGSYDATLASYEDAVQTRLAVDTPATLTVGTRVAGDEVRVVLRHEAVTDLSSDGLRAWVALVEDPVEWEPPRGWPSNGVTNHPFTVRAVRDLGPVAPTRAEQRIDITLPLDEEWDTSRTRLAFWLEQDADALGRFEPNEVVQAVSHPINSAGFTRQESRAVLIEAFSATWCGPCATGDVVLEDLAEDHGHPVVRTDDQGSAYLVAPRLPWPVVLAAAALAGVAMWFWRPGGAP